MNAVRPLQNCVVGISISDSGEMERLGFDRAEVNRFTVRLTESLLAAGARVAFGHDWRPSGVMEAVAALAIQYFTKPEKDAEASSKLPPIINRVAAPDVPYLQEG